MSAVAQIANAYPLMKPYAEDVVRVAKNLDIDPAWLANVINFESIGGNPQAVNTAGPNPTYATGLIQFMPGPGNSADRLGYTIEQIVAMSGKEQMPLVEAYFRMVLNDVGRDRLTSQEDVYMTVFYPVSIGNPDYQFPPKVVRQNNGIQTPRDYTRMANARAKLPVSGIGYSGLGIGGLSPAALAATVSVAALAVTLFWVYRQPIRARIAQLKG
jgi:hypothetical protein